MSGLRKVTFWLWSILSSCLGILCQTAKDGDTWLCVVAQYDHLDMVAGLAKKGCRAFLFQSSQDRCTCLILTAQAGCLEVVQHPVTPGGKALALKTSADCTCLHAEVHAGNLEL